jgi:hypothetical protein
MALQQTYDRTNLVDMLKRNILTIVFRKVDGEIREMRCTLNPELLQQALGTVDVDAFDESPTASVSNINVWDLDKDDWRSFRVANVIDVY